MMALRVLRKLRVPRCVPGLCTILLIICCCSMTKADGSGSCLLLRSYLDNSSLALNLTDKTAFCIPNLSPPEAFAWNYFSFNVSFNVSIYQNVSKAKSSVVLAIHLGYAYDPSTAYGLYRTTEPDFCKDCDPDYNPSCTSVTYINQPRTSYPAAASNASARITRTVDRTLLILVQIDMEDSPQASSVENTYAVTINYQNRQDVSMSVDVRGDGMQDPVNDTMKFPPVASSALVPLFMSMGLFSSMGQLLNLDNWNVESERSCIYHPRSRDYDNSRGLSLAAILSSVLGSAAATAITAAVLYLYFTSKYRRWKKEQEKLAKAMQQLPGVPTKLEFTEIKKATKNFHDTTKLGKGGFGAVYRCTLPASASRTGQATEVAVKKFTQEVEDRRYDDFLAEVSIINRLRHKNIVPLVGWSYNKGVPVLVYEYMTNGSLDQHLFRGGSGNNRHDHVDAAIWQWDTRYSIVRDIATGLHYVHHEHEPMVLHRDIKASNIMLDSSFGARLGDFGIACTVAVDRTSVTGVAGTIGYIAPDYVISHKATRQSDIYALGVLILEIVTGKKSSDVPPDDGHITDWIWRLRQEGKLLDAVDSGLVATDDRHRDVADEANRLLLLGLACTNPNPSNRPSMVEVVQVINKLAPAPEVPLERPTFVWPPADWRTRNSVYSTAMSDWERSSASTVELVQFNQELPPSTSTGKIASVRTYRRAASESRDV